MAVREVSGGREASAGFGSKWACMEISPLPEVVLNWEFYLLQSKGSSQATCEQGCMGSSRHGLMDLQSRFRGEHPVIASVLC